MLSKPENGRTEFARSLYKTTCRQLNEADAMRSLDDLVRIARSLHDIDLYCAVYDMRADYYSVNEGFNNKSTKYHDDAIAFAQDHNNDLLTGIYQHRKAVYYYIYKKNALACRYYLLAQDKFKKVGFDNLSGISDYFLDVADFYYSLEDYGNARIYLQLAKSKQHKVTRRSMGTVTALGLICRNTGKYDSALYYFNQTLAAAKSLRDSTWVAITLGNIGSVYFLQKDYTKAQPYIEIDYKQSVKYDEIYNGAIALLRLVKISLYKNELAKAQQQLVTAKQLLDRCNDKALAQRAEYYKLSADIARRNSEYKQASDFTLQYSILTDSLNKRDNLAAVERVRLKLEIQKNNDELDHIEADARARNFEQITIIVVLLLLIAIVVLIYNRRGLKYKRDKEILASEKLLVDEQLRNAMVELNGYTENLKQKNLLIDQFGSEIKRLQLKFDDTDTAVLLDEMTRLHIMTDDNWEEFKKLFNKACPDFIYAARKKFGTLSTGDIRLLTLIKLKLNNREAASMLGITTDGVKKAKQRLRKKLDLLADDDIDEIVGAI
ncbi:tetratricopeptide repeat protein [Mucilaginibacter pallidiroseus]|uniref:Tetratricopeptide repeat protein n=1 Tax=Mucilaginibacter pallidiroseus TaxID=2599295 RepID=A0A563TZN0_9SPHI|nr:tetratricopeptide repeat protein [Mucilaginibacter pallidiroseus]TWR24061.1 tetratricopeptide repeat protein [Mucilaginibacter pallidiroseus]